MLYEPVIQISFGTRIIVIQLLTNFKHSGVSTFKFEQVNAGWVISSFTINHLKRLKLTHTVSSICTDDYGNNEYLAVNYIRFFTKDIICL